MASSRLIDAYRATTATPTARSTQLAGDKAVMSSVARVLGTSVAEVQSQLRAGKTYGQMASARGKSADDVGKAILFGLKQSLLMNASTGKMTITQVQTVLANTQKKIAEIVAGKASVDVSSITGSTGQSSTPANPSTLLDFLSADKTGKQKSNSLIDALAVYGQKSSVDVLA